MSLLTVALFALLPHLLATRELVEPQAIHAQHKNSADIIDRMPGYHSQLPSNHHAGYIDVEHKKMFYYFVESENSPSEDPVVLWLNGGPGCSSFDGFVYEMGPFKFEYSAHKRLLLSDNPYAWNKVANMLYLDSPVGVGLSYSTQQEDYVTGDSQTAKDAEEALRGFFRKHPDFQHNKFFISGESYAGIYVPNLARAVVEGNDAGKEPSINIVGYLVGNGCTDEEVDGDAFVPFAAGKSLISKAHHKALTATCGGVYWNRTAGSECDLLYGQLMNLVSGLNVYDVLEDCYHGPNPSAAAESRIMYEKVQKQHEGLWPRVGVASKTGPMTTYANLGLNPPCTDARLADSWLNDPEVRQAIHAESLEDIGRWQICSDKISYTREIKSTIPIHRKLVEEHGLRALIYSGDHDLCVPHTGSERWTSELGYPEQSAWGPWYDADHQVAGYVVEYGLPELSKGKTRQDNTDHGLSYATVKGAGHMVPETNPRESLAMFERFINGKSIRN